MAGQRVSSSMASYNDARTRANAACSLMPTRTHGSYGGHHQGRVAWPRNVRTTQQAHPHSPEQREQQAEQECPTERKRWYRRGHAVQLRFSARKERLEHAAIRHRCNTAKARAFNTF